MISSLTYGAVIAHLLPGIIAFSGVMLLLDWLADGDLLTFLKLNFANWAIIGGAFLTGSLTMGLIVDGTRYGLGTFVSSCLRFPQRPEGIYKGVINNPQLFFYIYENSYRFYQYYSNMAVALLFFTVPLLLYVGRLAHWGITLMILVVLIVLICVHLNAARKSLSDFFRIVPEIFPSGN